MIVLLPLSYQKKTNKKLVRDVKFSVFIYCYKCLPGNVFGLVWKDKMVLINGRLNCFMGDMFNRYICPL